MNYKIVYDEKMVLNFLNFLPQLNANESYYIMLMARKKYFPSLIKSNDKTQLQRKAKTRDRILNTLRSWERPLGTWQLRDIPAPQESLVAYIHPNPRDNFRAAKIMAKSCIDLVFNEAKGFSLQAEALSAIQKSKAYNFVVTFDVDDKNIDLTFLYDVFDEQTINDIVTVIETRGGYHLLVKPTLAEKHKKIEGSWWKYIFEKSGADQAGDKMSPIPGTFQGGHKVKIIKL